MTTIPGTQSASAQYEVYSKTKNNGSLKTPPKMGQPIDPKIRFQGQWEDLETGLYKTTSNEMTIHGEWQSISDFIDRFIK